MIQLIKGKVGFEPTVLGTLVFKTSAITVLPLAYDPKGT